MDSTNRFSDRVADYVRYRPGYPEAMFNNLKDEFGLGSSSRIADVGSGSGILTRELVNVCDLVYGVEPNQEMRIAAEQQLAGHHNFHSVDGKAEQTGLAVASVDFVFAAQAFHWFERQAFLGECRRILAPGGKVVLIWNSRLTEIDPFHSAYEALICQFATDYDKINHQNIEDQEIYSLFEPAHTVKRTFPNQQAVDFLGLKGRFLSSSYIPKEDNPQYTSMIDELRRLFDEHHLANKLCIRYDTVMYVSAL